MILRRALLRPQPRRPMGLGPWVCSLSLLPPPPLLRFLSHTPIKPPLPPLTQLKLAMSTVVFDELSEEGKAERRVADERSQQFETNEDASQMSALLPEKTSWNAVSRALVGNAVIALFKFGIFLQTGSSAMLSEALHTLADCGNQGLLLKGLQQASKTPDKFHQYGYGKASFFWSLISALGMFWTGAVLSCGHGAYTLLHPPEMFEITKEMVAVLGFSFCVDGWVLFKTCKEVMERKPKDVGVVQHFRSIRDPFVLSVLYEDTAACSGVLLAAGGIVLSNYCSNVVYDTIGGISVGCLMALVSLKLLRLNYRFLLGQAVDDAIVMDIRSLLRARPAINAVNDVQTQWIGPYAFAFKAECDFNGRELAKRLEPVYIPLFKRAALDDRMVKTVMAHMAQDVTRLIEREVKEVEIVIRQKHPMAAFIELEPDSKRSFLRASDGRAWRMEEEKLILNRAKSSTTTTTPSR
ncbi:hypothetical protein BASA81_003164 [Batrachochytrium salamandrivorans]|nr:hypothetical protein BASA81_003164 [Batrachochytrium salamandrivorans]